MTSPSSLVEIEPDLSLSKRSKTSRKAWICSSSKDSTGVLGVRWEVDWETEVLMGAGLWDWWGEGWLVDD